MVEKPEFIRMNDVERRAYRKWSEKYIENPRIWYLIGVGKGDGYISNGLLSLETTDYDFANEFASACFEVFGKKPSIWYNKKKISYTVSVRRKSLYSWIESLSLDGILQTLKQDATKAKEFIKGFADSEGCVYVHKARKRFLIGIYNSDVGLLRAVKNLLFHHWQITSSLFVNEEKGSIHKLGSRTFKTTTDNYCLAIQGMWSIQKFSKYIGFSIPAKQKKLSLAVTNMGNFIKKRKWTEEEIDFLKRNIKQPIEAIAKRLNRTSNSVSSKIWRMRREDKTSSEEVLVK
jgi:intein-encoded DNA endonuclease-like protein